MWSKNLPSAVFNNAIDLHIRKTDAYYILEAESNDYIYYRTFPYWTSYGAYSVYRSVIQKLGLCRFHTTITPFPM